MKNLLFICAHHSTLMVTMPDDITFLRKKYYELRNTQAAVSPPDLIEAVRYCLRWKKNGVNGKCCTVKRIIDNLKLCAVIASINIQQQAACLVI